MCFTCLILEHTQPHTLLPPLNELLRSIPGAKSLSGHLSQGLEWFLCTHAKKFHNLFPLNLLYTAKCFMGVER